MSKTKVVDSYFESLTPKLLAPYNDYWNGIKPQTEEDIFRRWLFAFLSIHTTWESNVRGYEILKDLSWLKDKDLLLKKLTESKAGMQNNRTRFIWEFKEKYLADPAKYGAVKGSWQEHRNLLVKDLVGIGIAKVSFVLEMIYPDNCGVVCLDTHILRMFDMQNKGYKSVEAIKDYEAAENYWLSKAEKLKISSPMARHFYWDRLQGYEDTTYWSYVFHS